MKIALRHEDTDYWLAGEPSISQSVHTSAGDVRINGQISLDPQSRVRAVSMQFRDRKNLRTDISFGTVRKFANTAEAEEYCATYDVVHPRTGYLDFYDEAGVVFARMVNAVVLPPSRQPVGVSVIMVYQVVGGAILVADGDGGFDTPEITMGGEVVTMG
jgi:hypothetical protein